MKEQLDKMDIGEHKQVLDIIKEFTGEFTKTNTGILVSTDILSDECLKAIETYISFSLDQRKRLDEDLRNRKEYERLVS